MAAIVAPPHPTHTSWGKVGLTTYLRMRSAIRDPDLSLPAVVALHGMDISNPPPANLGEVTMNALGAYVNTNHSNVVQAGYDVYAPWQGRNWCAPTSNYSGNLLGTGTTGISDCMLAATADGHPANSVLLLATSGGGGSAFAWAAAHPTWFVAMFGMVPLCNLVDAHSRSLFGLPLAPSIEEQYGSTTWLANSAPYDPSRNPGSYTVALCAKMRCVWGGNDGTVSTTSSHAFAAAHPSITASWVTPNPSGHFVFLDNGWDEYEATRWFDNFTGRA